LKKLGIFRGELTGEPVTYLHLSLAKNSTLSATSSGSIQGTGKRLPAERSAVSGVFAPSVTIKSSFTGVLRPVLYAMV
jgi:hypothetical protein